MLSPSVFAERRQRLARRVGRSILLSGNGIQARNLPMIGLPFRQDSSFLYLTGHADPDAALLIDTDGTSTLFIPKGHPDDALWHGESPPPIVLAERAGVERVAILDTIGRHLQGKAPVCLAVSDPHRNAWLQGFTETPLVFGEEHGDSVLVDAIIALRRTKSGEEIAEMREAARHSVAAHRALMAATRPGLTERSLAALFHAILSSRGCAPGYGLILTQRGEVLHQERHDGTLEDGRLLLVDGGGEVASGYGVDITRTWPVSGTWSARQRAAYDAVLEAQRASIALCTVGRPYREVHDASCRVIARFLADEGLIRVSPEEAVERGAHAVFFPHGVGHLLGMDVHDLENFGDRPAYPKGVRRPTPFGTRYLRLNLPLEAGWVVTIEPGFYVVPAILADATLRQTFADAIDWDRAASWLGFGGIRIEDDVLVTSGAPEVLTADLPTDPDAIGAIVGSAELPRELAC